MADADWARASPGGAFVIAGVDNTTSREHGGTAGRALLHPGARPLPQGIDGDHAGFSPDGKYFVGVSGTNTTRARFGDPWKASTPTVWVLAVPDMRVVHRVAGLDPSFTSASTLVFRRERQPFQLDVTTGHVTSIGPTQKYGCVTENFPLNGCHGGGDLTSLLSASATSWLVADTDGTARTESLRVLTLATGSSRDLIKLGDIGESQSFRPLQVSPRGSRVCGWQMKWTGSSPSRVASSNLVCASLPNGPMERVFVGDQDPVAMAWLDEQRLVFHHRGYVIADLGARTIARLEGIPSSATLATALPGGNKLVLHWVNGGPSMVVDLAARTYAPFGPSGALVDVEPVPGSDRRFLLRAPLSTRPARALSWVDL